VLIVYDFYRHFAQSAKAARLSAAPAILKELVTSMSIYPCEADSVSNIEVGVKDLEMHSQTSRPLQECQTPRTKPENAPPTFKTQYRSTLAEITQARKA